MARKKRKKKAPPNQGRKIRPGAIVRYGEFTGRLEAYVRIERKWYATLIGGGMAVSVPATKIVRMVNPVPVKNWQDHFERQTLRKNLGRR